MLIFFYWIVIMQLSLLTLRVKVGKRRWWATFDKLYIFEKELKKKVKRRMEELNERAFICQVPSKKIFAGVEL
jgi:hypothetical protein